MRIVRVSEFELRRIFNEGRYHERLQSGEFHSTIVNEVRRKHGDHRVRNTRSQVVDYRDKHWQRVARVHQYRRKDGLLGASGRPDPKMVFHDGVLYALETVEQWDIPKW